MANLILTDKCQRNCPYCFAKESKTGEFGFEEFKKAVEFIKTGPPVVYLLGGEPTEHPMFTTFVEHLLNEKCLTRVFTNGMSPEFKQNNILKTIERMKDKHGEIDLLFNVNVNNPKDRSEQENILQELFFNNFNRFSYIGHTIYEATENLDYLIDIILDYSLDPAIRLGLALPIFGASNAYLKREDYTYTAKNILNLVKRARGLNISVEFDCGFPMCMFSFEEVSFLMQQEQSDAAFICGQALDIYPNLEVTNCFALSKLHAVSIMDFNNIEDLYKYFESYFKTERGTYTDSCQDCFYFNYACAGGCKAFLFDDLKAKEGKNEAN
jgi:radical SAM protein with 4Fe4S-binding SPASM domain